MRLTQLLLVLFVVGCGSDKPTDCCSPAQTGVRVVNAFTTPVEVLIDGVVVMQALSPASVQNVTPALGSHVLELRPTSGGATASQSITTVSGALNTVAVVRASNGTAATAILDDTGSVVPAGATKVRVLHLAPSAGELQVYRTQPDYQQPIQWQFPFTYQAQLDPLSAPFFQSTVGTWEIRVWSAPADASGWESSTVRVALPLKSGEKKTVLILDNPGGGVRIELI